MIRGISATITSEGTISPADVQAATTAIKHKNFRTQARALRAAQAAFEKSNPNTPATVSVTLRLDKGEIITISSV